MVVVLVATLVSLLLVIELFGVDIITLELGH